MTRATKPRQSTPISPHQIAVVKVRFYRTIQTADIRKRAPDPH